MRLWSLALGSLSVGFHLLCSGEGLVCTLHASLFMGHGHAEYESPAVIGMDLMQRGLLCR